MFLCRDQTEVNSLLEAVWGVSVGWLADVLEYMGSQYQQGTMVVVCWCLCSAVKDVVEVFGNTCWNPYWSFWRSFFKSARVSERLEVEPGCGSGKSIKTSCLRWYQVVQVDLTWPDLQSRDMVEGGFAEGLDMCRSNLMCDWLLHTLYGLCYPCHPGSWKNIQILRDSYFLWATVLQISLWKCLIRGSDCLLYDNNINECQPRRHCLYFHLPQNIHLYVRAFYPFELWKF